MVQDLYELQDGARPRGGGETVAGRGVEIKERVGGVRDGRNCSGRTYPRRGTGPS